jgi:hypothetical protein
MSTYRNILSFDLSLANPFFCIKNWHQMGCIALFQSFLETLHTTTLEALWSHAAKILFLLLGFLCLEFLVLLWCETGGNVSVEACRCPKGRRLSLEGLSSFQRQTNGQQSCDRENLHSRMDCSRR